ncbi:MAG: hydrogenase maturation nickel metallochaperone HypA [Propionibacteriaceae bacterium]|nr:hydrogenase maturation nickel metallochaperone HypA [Propionibacteriaceae bacterium]
MHELSLLVSVVNSVTQVARSRGATRIERVGLRVGARSGAVREALEGSWPLATPGTMCEQAILEIEEIPARVWCSTCEIDQVIDEFFALKCPTCGDPAGKITSGTEFDVAFADME